MRHEMRLALSSRDTWIGSAIESNRELSGEACLGETRCTHGRGITTRNAMRDAATYRTSRVVKCKKSGPGSRLSMVLPVRQ